VFALGLNQHMQPFQKKLVTVGVLEPMPHYQKRAIVLSNTIALISAALVTIFILYSLRSGWGFYHMVLAVTLLTLCAVPVLNGIGFITISRALLTVAIPLSVLFIIMLPRIQHPDRIDYGRSPGVFAVLLATSVIPVLIFSTQERRTMLFALGINTFFFASIDVFLRYFSKLHALPTFSQYLSLNLPLLIAYALLVSSVLSLKGLVDEFELENLGLIRSLNNNNNQLTHSNRELHELNKNIETQNEEIQAQSEELMQSQESLMLANQEIERQKLELEKQNELLEKSLDEQSKDLLVTNQQLISQNNELQQFSYTVSHNLRGPVASMLGLINIHHLSNTEEEQARVLSLIEQSARSLETIIRDLNKIVDIRNDKFAFFETVSLEQELRLITQSLNAFLIQNQVELKADIQCKEIVSIKAYINSILYNLLSNAIQYRDPGRIPLIKIRTASTNEHTILEVADNGLGIDLALYQGDLFKLYKRFHTHTQGKGLGLYLVKQQVDKLNGKIEIESKPQFGATFRVILPILRS
jgi:signal transduction histidine kinase